MALRLTGRLAKTTENSPHFANLVCLTSADAAARLGSTSLGEER